MKGVESQVVHGRAWGGNFKAESAYSPPFASQTELVVAFCITDKQNHDDPA